MGQRDLDPDGRSTEHLLTSSRPYGTHDEPETPERFLEVALLYHVMHSLSGTLFPLPDGSGLFRACSAATHPLLDNGPNALRLHLRLHRGLHYQTRIRPALTTFPEWAVQVG